LSLYLPPLEQIHPALSAVFESALIAYPLSRAWACKAALISSVLAYWPAGGAGPRGPGSVGDGIVKKGIASIFEID
jgi:hypothetical protein